jgi:hypothetical protein
LDLTRQFVAHRTRQVDGVEDQLDTEVRSQAYGGHVMRSLRAMIRKEFIHLRRNPNVVAFTIGLPITLVLLFGYALRLKVDQLPVAVWDQDQTFFSTSVADRLRRDTHRDALGGADSGHAREG